MKNLKKTLAAILSSVLMLSFVCGFTQVNASDDVPDDDYGSYTDGEGYEYLTDSNEFNANSAVLNDYVSKISAFESDTFYLISDAYRYFDTIREYNHNDGPYTLNQYVFSCGPITVYSDGKLVRDPSSLGSRSEIMSYAERAALIAKPCVTLSDYDKVRLISEWLCDNLTYDYTYSRHSIKDAIGDHLCVCSGYAQAFQAMAVAVGVDSYIITGDCGGSHAWNAVKLDGRWYYVDTTHMDQNGFYWEDKFLFGSASAKEMGYVTNSSLFISSLDYSVASVLFPKANTTLPEITETGVSGFVERLYQVALNRSSDATGKQNWINDVQRNGKTGADLALGFLYSDEFLKRSMSNSEFLDILYMTFFNRKPDVDGKFEWIKAMRNGASRKEVIRGFIDSTEFANLCLRYGIKSGSSAKANITVEPSQGTKDFVDRLYLNCLGRVADSKGFYDWTTSLANMKSSGSSAAYGFFFSNEFTNCKYSNEEFVTRLYLVFMDRQPDTAGFNDWVNKLNNGASREDVFYGFTGSVEWATICSKYGILK